LSRRLWGVVSGWEWKARTSWRETLHGDEQGQFTRVSVSEEVAAKVARGDAGPACPRSAATDGPRRCCPRPSDPHTNGTGCRRAAGRT
jgi:hypothetical protein